MLNPSRWAVVLILLIAISLPCAGEENVLTPKEKREGWQLLFDGKTLNGWMTSSEKPSKVPVEDGSIQPHGCGGYMMIHEKMWENFVLSLDFKISKKCNSGIFFRTYSLKPRRDNDVGYNGIEMAIDDSAPRADYVDTGAIYDLAKPTKNAMKPVGEWNHLILTLDGNKVKVELNWEVVNQVDLDKFTEKNRRPDGTEHKFDEAFRDHPRKGYIGLQDHGSPCWFKNIKLKPLPASNLDRPADY
jgi:hypothetical protein